jgi:hypothetical protein
MLYKPEDNSIISTSGKILHFGADRFITDICQGNCCFICGANNHSATFNKEHILPKWILKKYNLFEKTINLPSTTKVKYSKYTLPCCGHCNSLMGEKMEQPIRELIEAGFDAVSQYVEEEGGQLFFIWLALIFIKTHLNDKHLRRNLKQKDSEMIADAYDWGLLHHIHCIARSFYTGCEIPVEKIGSFVMIDVDTNNQELFDYLALHDFRSILLRLDNICFIVVFDDSCGSLVRCNHVLENISGMTSPIKAREILVHLSYANESIKNRPEFYTMVDVGLEQSVMGVNLPEDLEFNDFERTRFGEILYFCCKDLLSSDTHPGNHRLLKEGHITFLSGDLGLLSHDLSEGIAKLN